MLFRSDQEWEPVPVVFETDFLDSKKEKSKEKNKVEQYVYWICSLRDKLVVMRHNIKNGLSEQDHEFYKLNDEGFKRAEEKVIRLLNGSQKFREKNDN